MPGFDPKKIPIIGAFFGHGAKSSEGVLQMGVGGTALLVVNHMMGLQPIIVEGKVVQEVNLWPWVGDMFALGLMSIGGGIYGYGRSVLKAKGVEVNPGAHDRRKGKKDPAGNEVVEKGP